MDSPNGKLHEVVAILDDRLEALEHMHENTSRRRWLYRRELRTTVNAVGIVRDALSASAHTYSLGG